MLGLTARRIRVVPAPTARFDAISAVSGLRRSGPLLDRLNSRLTRHHD